MGNQRGPGDPGPSIWRLETGRPAVQKDCRAATIKTRKGLQSPSRGEIIPVADAAGNLILIDARLSSRLSLYTEGLSVEGMVSLSGCTGLAALPEGLSVGGCLYLSGCTGLTALPEGLGVGHSLNLNGCTGLTALTVPRRACLPELSVLQGTATGRQAPRP